MNNENVEEENAYNVYNENDDDGIRRENCGSGN